MTMTFKEYLIESVIQGKFGKNNSKNENIDIPKGYDSFYVKKISDNTGKIIGVKSDGTEHTISSGHYKLMTALAKEYNSGGKGGTGMKKMSLTQAFGSSLLNVMSDLNIKIIEKPSYFENIRKQTSINELQLKKIEKALGYKLKSFNADEIFKKGANDLKNTYPQQDAKHPKESFIVKFQSGNNYLADTTGASSYIRNWAYIK
jgi:hypothetical protein